MAKAKVYHDGDAVTILFEGKKSSPEPSTGIIKFPGGHVEVSRCSDGSYWAHLEVGVGKVIDSRIDWARCDNRRDPITTGSVADFPDADLIRHVAIRLGKSDT
jgi:hypothetical protein